ncbi:MAG TPA: DedA family protein [Candidatus Paceibacterota bacterium]
MSRQLFRFIIQYKYAIIFPIATLEGPIITLVSGFLISLGILSFVPTFLVVFAGDLISDSFYFWLGSRGRGFVERIKFLHITPARLEKVEQHYEKHPGKTLLVSKASYGIGSLFLIAAGASKMAYQKFLEYITPMNAVRSSALLLIGYFLGRAVRYSGTYLEWYTFGVIIVLPLGYYIIRKIQENNVERV